MTTVLVTGANGFIGSALCRELVADSMTLKAVVRHQSCCPVLPNTEVVVVPDINAGSQWQQVLAGVDVVVHLAARVHVMEETAQNPERLFNEVNLDGTRNLAKQATQAGVKRFIYISTIKVNGEGDGRVLHPEAAPIPQDPYAASKWHAERCLQQLSETTGLEVVIIRPPLVYGPGVKGNFLRLLNLVHRNLPIPLGAVSNKRSMVYVANLCHLIKTCIDHPQAAGQLLLVSDNQDMSTPDLIRLIAKELKHNEKLLPLPLSLLYAGARLLGKEPEIHRLCGSLQVDIGTTMNVLSWRPPFSIHQGVHDTVQWFLLNRKGKSS